MRHGVRRVVGVALLLVLVWIGAGAVLSHHVEGRLTVTQVLQPSLTRKYCETRGWWRSVDGSQRLDDVELDGGCGEVGEEVTAYREISVVPGRTLDDVVHESTCPWGAVVVVAALGAIVAWFCFAS